MEKNPGAGLPLIADEFYGFADDFQNFTDDFLKNFADRLPGLLSVLPTLVQGSIFFCLPDRKQERIYNDLYWKKI